MKRIGKVLAVLVAFLMVAVIISVVHHYQLRAARDAYIAELKAKGEPMDLAQLIPPPVPPEKNGADALRQAEEMFFTNKTFLSSNYFYGGMKMVAPGKAASAAERSALQDDYYATNSWTEVRDAVAKNADAFALLHEIIQRPNFNGGIDYSKGIGKVASTNLLLSQAKAAACRLGTAALSDLHAGDTRSAVENVRAMLAIAKGSCGERTIISQLVGIAIAVMAAPHSWEILQSTNVADEQLAALQKDWTDFGFSSSMEKTFEMERASDAVTTSDWRRGNSDFDDLLLNPPANPFVERHELSAFDRVILKSRIFRWRYWWSYSDEIRQLKGSELVLEALRAAQTNNALLLVQQTLETNISEFSLSTNEESYYWFSNAMNVDLHFILSESIHTSAKSFPRAIKMEMQR